MGLASQLVLIAGWPRSSPMSRLSAAEGHRPARRLLDERPTQTGFGMPGAGGAGGGRPTARR
jgi:hypothetical protein